MSAWRRREPLDPPLLLQHRHLLRASFDLRIGLVHGIRYGRESLALDLVEELRVPLVDRFTLRLLRRCQLKREDLIEREEDGAARLSLVRAPTPLPASGD